MKKAKRKATNELRSEYKRSDFGSLVRGKYAAKVAAETNVVDVTRMFTEDCQIVILAGEDDAILDESGEYRNEFVLDLKRDLADLGLSRDEIQHVTTSVGHGADAYAIGLIISGLSAVLLSGKKFEESLDAWLGLAKRLSALLKKLRRHGKVFLSEPTGAALALGVIVEAASECETIRLQSSLRIILNNASVNREVLGIFLQQPERYYVYTFNVAERETHIICIRSTGDLEFHHVLPIDDWQRFYND